MLEKGNKKIDKDFIYAQSKKIEIQPNTTKTWDINIDELLNSFSHKGFQKPGTYTIKWKIIYQFFNKQKYELISEPFVYLKKSNPDLALKLLVKESDNNILMLYISNFGDGDIINIYNNRLLLILKDVLLFIILKKNQNLSHYLIVVFMFFILKCPKYYRDTNPQAYNKKENINYNGILTIHTQIRRNMK